MDSAKQDFSTLLDRAKLSKTDLSLLIGIHRSTIYGWQDEPPAYAVAYLKKHAETLALQETVAMLKALLKQEK